MREAAVGRIDDPIWESPAPTDMTTSRRKPTRRSPVARVLFPVACAYLTVISLVALVERISRQHWTVALFYLYPAITWSTFLLIFWRMPDLRELQAERREALNRGMPPKRLGSPMMVVPFAMGVGLVAERISYSTLHRIDPTQGTRNIFLAVAAALLSAAVCYELLVLLAKRGERRQSKIVTGGVMPDHVPDGVGLVRLVRDTHGWRGDGSYEVLIDGLKACSLRPGRHQDISVAAGTHGLRVTKGGRGSPTIRIVVEKGTTQVWACGPTPPGHSGIPVSTAYIKLRPLTGVRSTSSSAPAEQRSN